MSDRFQQKHEHATAQDSSRQHNGNVIIQQQNNYSHPATLNDLHTATRDISLRDALEFRRMDFRADTITTAYSNTCQWLFETPEYKRWLDPSMRDRHNGLLWIKGNPGAGKSTIMKRAVRHASESYTDHHVLSFFFNARGESLEKTAEGMYRALVHQVADELPESVDSTPSAKLWEYKEHGWPIEHLKDLLRAAVRHCGQTTPLICFVDALDEAVEGDVRDLVRFFQELGKTATTEGIRFLVCFASRHYPRISVQICEGLLLDGHQGHQDDIADYVRHNMNVEESQLMEELAPRIKEMSQGVFLWVVLVVDKLNTECDRGNSHQLREQLFAVPTDLHTLLDRIVSDGTRDGRLLAAAQWVLFANEPLDDEQIYFAVMTSIGQLPEAQRAWDLRHITENAIENFILDGTKGLIEIKHARAQFIHESVREYFFDCGLRNLDPAIGEDVGAISHERLAQWCITYLRHVPVDATLFVDEKPGNESKELRRAIRRFPALSYPLLQHVIQGSLQYAEIASKSGRHQDAFVDAFPREHWILLAWTCDVYYNERPSWQLYPVGATLLHLLTTTSCESLIRTELERRAQCPAQAKQAYLSTGLQPGEALDFATRSGYEKIAHIILDDCADATSVTVQALCRLALYTAIIEDKPDFVWHLLESNSVVYGYPPRDLLTLIEAVSQGHVPIVGMLLGHGIGLSADHWLEFTLIRAISEGHQDIVMLLLKYLPDDFAGSSFQTYALRAASSRQHRDIINVLLEHGINAGVPFMDQTFALVAAVVGGNHDTVKILLEGGADANAQCPNLEPALIKAILRQKEETVRLLLEHGADPNAESSFSISSLIEALSGRNEKFVLLLIEHRYDINLITSFSVPVLIEAMLRGDCGMVQILLEHGADTNSPPAFRDLVRRPRDPFQLLWRFGAGGRPVSALQFAEAVCDKNVVEVLRRHSANGNTLGKGRRRDGGSFVLADNVD
ncbi:hypothetical protein Q7P37_009138 [Cladosporium fusiforme]